MKIRQSILNWLLLLVGLVTLLYLRSSLAHYYVWTSFGEGFLALFVLIPITVISGVSCLLGFFVYFLILVISKKENSLRRISTIHLVLTTTWLIFIIGSNVIVENIMLTYQRAKLKGVFLNPETKLGEILPKTKWIRSNQQIFYFKPQVDSSLEALYLFDAKMRKPRKIIDKCRWFGWLPNGNDIFALSEDTLYLLKDSGVVKEEICTFGYYYMEGFGGEKIKSSALMDFEWSPKGDKFAFVEIDRDSNGNGKLDGHDNRSFYIFDLATKSKQKIGFEKDARFERFLWNKTGDALYVKYWKAISPNDVRYYICSYDLNTREFREIAETKEQRGIIIENYVEKVNLFYTQRYNSYRIMKYKDEL